MGRIDETLMMEASANIAAKEVNLGQMNGRMQLDQQIEDGS
jgi:hypothetical protein